MGVSTQVFFSRKLRPIFVPSSTTSKKKWVLGQGCQVSCTTAGFGHKWLHKSYVKGNLLAKVHSKTAF